MRFRRQPEPAPAAQWVELFQPPHSDRDRFTYTIEQRRRLNAVRDAASLLVCEHQSPPCGEQVRALAEWILGGEATS